MCRSSERVRAALAQLIMLSVVILTAAGPAAADPGAADHGPTPAPSSDPVGPIVGRVLSINAPVTDIVTTTVDRARREEVAESRRKTVITLDATVLFGRDSSKINSAAGRRLDELARQLAGRDPGRLTVTGYTDDLGSAEHGLRLSKRRAGAVADRLGQQLPKDEFEITAVGRGEADPRVPNDSEANRRKNRRVEIEYRPQ